MKRRAVIAVIAAAPMLAAVAAEVGTDELESPTASFAYRAQPSDTLIGLGRRLLIEPRRWHEVQRLNHIVDPRRIPRGSVVRIPYAWLRMREETATVATVAGTVKRGAQPLTVGENLAPGTRIETGADGSVTLDLADGSVVTLQKSSVLEIQRLAHVEGIDNAHDIGLKLQTGRIESAVKPHRDVGRFEIVTPVAVSAVRGTKFRDGFDAGDGAATAETLEGTVSVAAGPAAVGVSAGFGTRVAAGAPPLPPMPLLPPPDLSAVAPTNSRPQLRIVVAPVPGAKSYRVQLAADAEFHAIAADVLTPDGSLTLAALPDGDYWLRARSIDSFGIEGTDGVRRLVQHVLPDPPQALYPASGARTSGTALALRWQSLGAGARYRLQVARDSAFDAPVIDRPTLAVPSAEVTDLDPGEYYWRLAALNEQGEAGPWGAVQRFTLRPTAPEIDVSGPDRGAMHFSWKALDGQTYRLQIAARADFAHPLLDERLSDAAYTSTALTPGIYFARLQLIDPDGGAGPFGRARRFTRPLPLWVKVFTPFGELLTLIR